MRLKFLNCKYLAHYVRIIMYLSSSALFSKDIQSESGTVYVKNIVYAKQSNI